MSVNICIRWFKYGCNYLAMVATKTMIMTMAATTTMTKNITTTMTKSIAINMATIFKQFLKDNFYCLLKMIKKVYKNLI